MNTDSWWPLAFLGLWLTMWVGWEQTDLSACNWPGNQTANQPDPTSSVSPKIQNFMVVWQFCASSLISLHQPKDRANKCSLLTWDPPHLDCIGVVLWAANHTSGPVETCRGLEGDCEIVGLWDVLNRWGARVGLHDGWKLKRQNKWEQLLQPKRVVNIKSRERNDRLDLLEYCCLQI